MTSALHTCKHTEQHLKNCQATWVDMKGLLSASNSLPHSVVLCDATQQVDECDQAACTGLQ